MTTDFFLEKVENVMKFDNWRTDHTSKIFAIHFRSNKIWDNYLRSSNVKLIFWEWKLLFHNFSEVISPSSASQSRRWLHSVAQTVKKSWRLPMALRIITISIVCLKLSVSQMQSETTSKKFLIPELQGFDSIGPGQLQPEHLCNVHRCTVQRLCRQRLPELDCRTANRLREGFDDRHCERTIAEEWSWSWDLQGNHQHLQSGKRQHGELFLKDSFRTASQVLELCCCLPTAKKHLHRQEFSTRRRHIRSQLIFQSSQGLGGHRLD